MPKIEDLLKSELGNIAISMDELTTLIHVLDLVSDRLLNCECANSDHTCSLWLVGQVRASLECHVGILEGSLRYVRSRLPK